MEIDEAVFLLCLFAQGQLVSTSGGNLGTETGSSNGENQDYFFYQPFAYPRDCNEALQRCSTLSPNGVYVIKPDGYPDPFDIYCQNDANSERWTVIQRRVDSHVQYSRLWEDFRDGFGFLSNDFWLGNEKLSYLTHQGHYELRVDLQLSNGSSFNVTYSTFRIGDEWNHYRLVELVGYRSYGDGVITACPRNMVYGNCTCHGTCGEPSGSSGCPRDCEIGTEGCFCPTGYLMNGAECVPQNECPCFWPEVNLVIPNGRFQGNSDCTKTRSCINNQLTDEQDHGCGSNARCGTRDDVRDCYCDEGYRGDGQNCDPLYTDCYDAYMDDHRQDGVYLIKPTSWPGSAFNVSCVMSTNGGGWTVFQRRTDGQTNFYRNWTSYREGFGSFGGDFWLGNEKIYYLTNQKSYKFRVDYLTSSNTARYEEYSSFSIAAENDQYRLTATGPSGSAGSGFGSATGKAFSTYDRDNDACGTHHCAVRHRGAWWYTDYWCSASLGSYCYYFGHGSTKGFCGYMNLNGDYGGGNGENVFFFSNYKDCNLQFAEMKIRPTG